MTEYILLIPDSDAAWAALSADERQAVLAQHRAFSDALDQRGHRVVGGAQLAPAAQALTVRHGDGGPVVTEGPYAESSEQVSGFYLIESDDRDDLVECLGLLARAERGLELRECLRGS